jgi:hypothetical protein
MSATTKGKAEMKGVVVRETQKSGIMMFGSSSYSLEYEQLAAPALSNNKTKPPKGVADCVKGLPWEWTSEGDEAWALVQDPNCFDKDGEGWLYTEKRDSRSRKWWRSIGKDSADVMALLQHPLMMAAVGLMCLRLLSGQCL